MTVKSSWAAGDVLAAADLTDTFADKNNNKNLLYNGAMQVAQRGTSVSTGAGPSNTYLADRWNASNGSLGTHTYSVENDAPIGSGLRKSAKILCTTADASPAAGDTLYFTQGLEGQDLQRIAKGTASAQQLTLSFWVKSNVTGTYIATIKDEDNSRMCSQSYIISASATWEKKTITFPADTTGAFDNDNAASLYLFLWLGAGSTFTSGTLQTTWANVVNANYAVGQTNLAAATNNYWQVTGVQLEVGPVATSFEFKSYGQELRECQRYYTRTTATSAYGPLNASGYITSATNAGLAAQFPVVMRATPSSVDFANTAVQNSGGSIYAVTNIAFTSQTGPAGVVIDCTSSGMVVTAFARLIGNNNAAAYLGFSAEL